MILCLCALYTPETGAGDTSPCSLAVPLHQVQEIECLSSACPTALLEAQATVGCGEERLPAREARFLPEADGILTHPGAERQKLPFRRLPSAISSRQVLQGSLTFCDLTAQLCRVPAHCSLSHTLSLTHTLAPRQLFRYICDCVQYSPLAWISNGA